MAFPRRLLVEGEELILDLRPHPVALALPAIVTIVAVIGGIWLTTLVDGVMVWVILAAVALLLVAYPLRHLVDWLTSHFVVTSDRIIHRQGLIAKSSMEVPLEAINDVRFSQGVIDRMLGAGTLVIQSASESGRQEFSHIRKPEDVQKTIYHQGELNQSRMFRGAGGGGAAPSPTTELERLADLRAKGVLTEEEFQAQKAKILGRAEAATPGTIGRMPVGDLDHLYYWTRDMDAAVAFYRDVVGLELVRRDGDAWAQFEAGPVRFALHGTDDETAGRSGTVVFRVGDLDAARWDLEARGARFEDHVGEVGGFARFATMRDPDGNPVQIIEYLG